MCIQLCTHNLKKSRYSYEFLLLKNCLLVQIVKDVLTISNSFLWYLTNSMHSKNRDCVLFLLDLQFTRLSLASFPSSKLLKQTGENK